MFSKIAIVGTGLLGASIGLAVRQKSPGCRIVGIGRRRETLEVAQRIGAIDELALSIAEGVAGCDLVVICTPVGRIVEQVFEVAQATDASSVITDVGSTKQAICEAVDKRSPLPNGCRFLGGHPIAGGEKTGPGAASASLFESRTVILTPTRSCDDETVDLLRTFWETLGAKTACMSPAEHDRILARTSHLPHVVSAVLATICDRATCGDYCGTGYESMTRLAAGDPELWRDILMTNREEVCAALDDFVKTCLRFRGALAGDTNDDTADNNAAAAVMRFLENASRNEP